MRLHYLLRLIMNETMERGLDVEHGSGYLPSCLESIDLELIDLDPELELLRYPN
jgi:hypothetical protein